MPDLDELLEFAIELAREAGRIQLDGLSREQRIELKSPRELVTPIDHACEEAIVARIRAAYPDHGYLAEESHAAEGETFRWIVDPVDGTTNYAQRLPAFTVSIGLEREGRLVLGVVAAPYLDELFSAREGGGAFFRQGEAEPQPMRVSRTAELQDAVLATGFSYVQNQTPNDNFDNFIHVSRITRAVRRMGSAALDLAYVADGRFDGFWEMHLKPYDVAAGAVLIQEAGGRVTDLFGGDQWLNGQSFLASNGLLHEALHASLTPVRPDAWIRRPDA